MDKKRIREVSEERLANRRFERQILEKWVQKIQEMIINQKQTEIRLQGFQQAVTMVERITLESPDLTDLTLSLKSLKSKSDADTLRTQGGIRALTGFKDLLEVRLSEIIAAERQIEAQKLPSED